MAQAEKASGTNRGGRQLMPASANRPLAGVIVLDFGQVYQGPYAALLIAKAGADVIKIEPAQGEPLRRRARRRAKARPSRSRC
jgi:crotonobetainyl-CoA:carnitine CoA-transferase CaiB-like acyl-CoA transferase